MCLLSRKLLGGRLGRGGGGGCKGFQSGKYQRVDGGSLMGGNEGREGRGKGWAHIVEKARWSPGMIRLRVM